MWMTWDQICPKVEEREVVPKIIPQTGNSSHHEISRLCFISNFNGQSRYQKQPMGIFKKRRAHLVREIKKQKASSLCRKCFAGILCVKWVERVEEAKHQTWMNTESWGSVTETDFMRGWVKRFFTPLMLLTKHGNWFKSWNFVSPVPNFNHYKIKELNSVISVFSN